MKTVYPENVSNYFLIVIFVGLMFYFGWSLGSSIYNERVLLIQNFIDSVILISVMMVFLYYCVSIKVDSKYIYLYKLFKRDKIERTKINGISINVWEYFYSGLLIIEVDGKRTKSLISFLNSMPYSKTRSDSIKHLIDNLKK